MNYKDLKLSHTTINSDSFELEFTHPNYKFITFSGEFESFELYRKETSGSWEVPSSTNVDFFFSVDMDTLEIFDVQGYAIDSVNKDVIELIESHISEYVYENLPEFV